MSVQPLHRGRAGRLRVAVLDPHELAAAGLTSMLRRFEDRTEVVDQPGPVDVILYGVRDHLGQAHDKNLHRLLRTFPGSVIVVGWFLDDPGVQLALSCGAHGFLSKTGTAEELVPGIEQQLEMTRNQKTTPGADGHCYPEVELAGLTPRERDTVTLVAAGLTNAEIARQLFVSVNSIKAYLKTAYRKIGVTRRAQAVLWAERHGLVDTSERPLAREDEPSVDAEPSLYLVT